LSVPQTDLYTMDYFVLKPASLLSRLVS
jgi:hypothetical protein